MARSRNYNFLSKEIVDLESSDSEAIFEMRTVRKFKKNRIESTSRTDSSTDIDKEVITMLEPSGKSCKNKRQNSNNDISIIGTGNNKSNKIIKENNSTKSNDIYRKKKSSSFNAMNLSDNSKVIKKKKKKRRSRSLDFSTDVSIISDQSKKKLLKISENNKKHYNLKKLRCDKEISDPHSKDSIYNRSSSKLGSTIQNKKTVSDFQPIIMGSVEKIKDKLMNFTTRINSLQTKFFDKEIITTEDAEDAVFVFDSIIHKIKGEIIEQENELKNAYGKIANMNDNKLENTNEYNMICDTDESSPSTKTQIQKEEKVIVQKSKQNTPTINSIEATINERLKKVVSAIVLNKQLNLRRSQTPMPKSRNSDSDDTVIVISPHKGDNHKPEKENNVIDVQETTQTTGISKNTEPSEKLNVNSDIPISSDRQNSEFTEKSNVIASNTSKIVSSSSQNSVLTDTSNGITPDINCPKTDSSNNQNSVFTDVPIVATPSKKYPKADSSGSQNAMFTDISSDTAPDINYPKAVSSNSQDSVFTGKSKVSTPDKPKLKRRQLIADFEKDSDSNDIIVNKRISKRISKKRKIKAKTDNKLNLQCQVELRKLESCKK